MSAWTCSTCTTVGRRGYCAPGRCYCGHETCHAFATWQPRRELDDETAARAVEAQKTSTTWAEREESTWIDQM